MKRILLFILSVTSPLFGTPSSLFWTNCTTDIVDTGNGHIDFDNYFAIFNRSRHNRSFPPDLGLEFGIFGWKNLKAEAGFDYFIGEDNPIFFNAKIGLDEDKLFSSAPAINLGIFDIGTNFGGRHPTNQNIIDLIIGKSLPKRIGGRLFVAGFWGNRSMGPDRRGFMIGYENSLCKAMDRYGNEYDKWVFGADYASGKNTIGGGGFSITRYFGPNISIETGPVWFNSAEINGKWKWSVQIDIDFPIF